MTSAAALIRRIDSAAAAGRGLRLAPGETDLLRAILELSEAHLQADALDADAEPPHPPHRPSTAQTRRGE